MDVIGWKLTQEGRTIDEVQELWRQRDEQKSLCIICLEDLIFEKPKQGESIVRIVRKARCMKFHPHTKECMDGKEKCGHLYHESCLNRFMILSISHLLKCPLCRHYFSERDVVQVLIAGYFQAEAEKDEAAVVA